MYGGVLCSMFIATSLSYYKRPEIQAALLRHAEDKEIGVMFGLEKFGKRPDALRYEQDVMELAKKKVSSFHCSEELWTNPLAIRTGMARPELDELRKGWDLILDIDCKDWEFAKITTHLFIRALQDHGIHTIGLKFSGNKGFHIIVPFETFPQTVPFEGEIRDVKDLFPEGPRRIALYLLSFITTHYVQITNEEVIFTNEHKIAISKLERLAENSGQSLFPTVSYDSTEVVYSCNHCGHKVYKKEGPEFIHCEQCNSPVEKSFGRSKSNTEKEQIFNWYAVIELDTVLISSRHLYRMPYALHEKSGLASVPIAIENLFTFEKEKAKPELVDGLLDFVDRSNTKVGEALQLLRESFDNTFVPQKEQRITKKLELPKEAIEEKFFPPVIQKILAGLEDGKKRALFILVNFLGSCGWSYEQIEQRVYEWNQSNPEPLREQYLKGQLVAYKKRKEPLLPPSPANRDYYVFITETERQKYGLANPVLVAKRNKERAIKEEKAKAKKAKKAKKITKTTKKSEKIKNKENNKEKAKKN